MAVNMSLEECFKGKTILVTGAGSGIGRAICQRLHGYGAKVYAVSRSKEPLDSLTLECPNIIPTQLDIGANWGDTRKIVENMKELDIVINNAATMAQIPFLDVTEKLYDSFSNVNLKAVTNISQTVAKNMIAENKKGTIINISSVAASRAFNACSTYCSFKAAMDMLTKCMALELGKHSIRVNSINLGMVRTGPFDNMALAFGEEKMNETLSDFFSKVPYGNDFLPMDDVVNTILFTASDLAPTLTGSCITIDGGYSTS